MRGIALALLLSVTQVIAGPSADLFGSKWDTFYNSNNDNFNIHNVVTLTGATGKYETDNLGTGSFSGFVYTPQANATLDVTGNWKLGNSQGTVKFTIYNGGKSIKGSWKDSDGNTGQWAGFRLEKTTDPKATALPTPSLGARDDAQYFVRHAHAILSALKRMDLTCTNSLFGAGPIFINNTSNYRFYANFKKNGVAKTVDTVADSSLTPYDAALKLVPTLQAQGVPCALKTEAQMAEISADSMKKVIAAAQTNLNNLITAVTTGPDANNYKGRLVAPSVITSDNEVIISDTMDPATQKKLLAQVDQGVQEKTTVDQNVTQPETKEKTFGIAEVLALKFSSETRRLNNTLPSYIKIAADLLFLTHPLPLFKGTANARPKLEPNGVQLTAQIEAITPGGFKTLKSIDEFESTTFERPEIIFLDDVVLFSYPAECIPTVVGPACIEGKITGSVGVKPYGITMNPQSFRDYQAYVRPYSRIDLEVFGGLEYEVAHAGVAGAVAILNGTFALLAGNIGDKSTQTCLRAEVDKFSFLDGRIFIDIQGDALPDDQVNDIRDGVKNYCEKAKGVSAQIIDFRDNVEQGLLDGAKTVTDTAKHAADTIVKVGDQAKDAVGGAVEQVTSKLPAVKVSVPALNLAAPSASNFSNSVKSLKQQNCDTVSDKLANVLKLRYTKDLYKWQGVTLDRHHKWYETCTSLGE